MAIYDDIRIIEEELKKRSLSSSDIKDKNKQLFTDPFLHTIKIINPGSGLHSLQTQPPITIIPQNAGTSPGVLSKIGDWYQYLFGSVSPTTYNDKEYFSNLRSFGNNLLEAYQAKSAEGASFSNINYHTSPGSYSNLQSVGNNLLKMYQAKSAEGSSFVNFFENTKSFEQIADDNADYMRKSYNKITNYAQDNPAEVTVATVMFIMVFMYIINSHTELNSGLSRAAGEAFSPGGAGAPLSSGVREAHSSLLGTSSNKDHEASEAVVYAHSGAPAGAPAAAPARSGAPSSLEMPGRSILPDSASNSPGTDTPALSRAVSGAPLSQTGSDGANKAAILSPMNSPSHTGDNSANNSPPIGAAHDFDRNHLLYEDNRGADGPMDTASLSDNTDTSLLGNTDPSLLGNTDPSLLGNMLLPPSQE